MDKWQLRRRLLSERASGILLHVTSLPGPHGCGDLGPSAYRFVDFLAEAGQRWWQMLPVGPLGHGHSPYQALSTFAGNPLLVSLELLAQKGWLTASEMTPTKGLRRRYVNYPAAIRFRESRLRRAFAQFERRAASRDRRHLEAFQARQGRWLADYVLFRALREAYGGAPWTEWEPGIRQRQPAALGRAQKALATDIRYHTFVQHEFFSQWQRLCDYCRQRDVGLIGDLPFFVSHDSVDVWAHPGLFVLDRLGRPRFVAGVPPDYFSKTGQLWGNPLYHWAHLRRQGYTWWIARLRGMYELFDAVRLDHFIGFHRCWAVAATAETARDGRFVSGPGAHFFEAVQQALGNIQLIAEDLGTVTQEVKVLREGFGFPGMRVLQFAFGNDPEAAAYRPHTFPRRCVVYTGTHDNDTVVGWFRGVRAAASTRSEDAIRRERAVALQYLGSDGREIHWGLIRLALMSVADTVIIPAQDLLGLDSRARMNLPGTIGGNWRWRLTDGALTSEIATRLLRLTETYGRRHPTGPQGTDGGRDHHMLRWGEVPSMTNRSRR